MAAEPALRSAAWTLLSVLRTRRGCRHRAAVQPTTTTIPRWTRLVKGIRRLAVIRRTWAYLGQWLQAVKQRGLGRDHPLLR